MKDLNVLWAAGMGALGGAILYVTGRQDGREQGCTVGFVAGINAKEVDKSEVKAD